MRLQPTPLATPPCCCRCVALEHAAEGVGHLIGGAILKLVFREAKIHDAVLFFDECEALFRTRDHGGADRLLRAMLQETEKCKGLVFLATNRPAELDEAMPRRQALREQRGALSREAAAQLAHHELVDAGEAARLRRQLGQHQRAPLLLSLIHI